MSAMASGKMPPAAAPASTRSPASEPSPGASAVAASAAASASRQTRITRCLPIASPTGPSTGCTSA
jgi:hypothetical protein